MARPLRIDTPGSWHHVFLRGARRAPIFGDDEDCFCFLDLLETASRRYGIEPHAYSLMPNHYHLLLRSSRGLLSRGMAFLNGQYTKKLNARHPDWDGPVFRGRFQSKLVEDERYLVELLAYIHLNPVAARLVKRPDDECWTSHRAYIGLDMPPSWLHTADLLRAVGGPDVLTAMLLRIVRSEDRWPAQRQLDLASFWASAEVPRVGQASGTDVTSKPVKPFRSPTAEDILACVCELTGTAREAIEAGIPGRRGNPARRFAIWALAAESTLTQAQIGALFGMSGSHVGQVLGTLRRGKVDELVAAWMERWDEAWENINS